MTGTEGSMIEPKAWGVSTFYMGKLTKNKEFYSGVAGMLLRMAIGTVHCILWTFQFSSHTEQVTWHTPATVMICMPGGLFVIVIAIDHLDNDIHLKY